MSLLDSIRDFFSPPQPAERMLTPTQVWGQGGAWRPLTGAGIFVTPDTVMKAAQGACIRLIADDIAALPVDVYRKVNGRPRAIDPPPWLLRPGASRWYTRPAFVSEMVVSLLGDGNAFVRGFPNVLMPQMFTVLDPGIVQMPEGSLDFRVGLDTLSELEVMHIGWVTQPGQRRAISVIDAAEDITGLEVAARAYAGAYFRNGGALGGIISVPGGPETVDADNVRQQFQTRHSGTENAHLPAVLTGGATYSADTITPQEAQLEPLWRQVLEAAARLYHVPPHMLASQQSGGQSYASVEQKAIEYVQHAIVTVTTRLEAALSLLVPGDDTYVKFNTNALLRGDTAARGQFYSLMLQAKVMTRDEVREKEDLPYMGELGWLETPNNTGDAEPPARSLSIDTVTIADQSAERIADTAAAGAAVAAAEARKTAEGVSADLRALTETVRAQAAEIATLRDDRASITALLTERNRPPDIRIDGDHVYYQRGTEVERKKVIRDETGRVIGMVAA